MLARRPNERELAVLAENHHHHLMRFRANPQDAHRLLSIGESAGYKSLLPPDLAALTAVANLVLNLDEALCRP